MRKEFLFLKGILALTLVFGLVLASCENNGTQDISLPKVSSPRLTATKVTGGVKLSWPAIEEVQDYQIIRTAPKGQPLELDGSPSLNKGIWEYYDIVGNDNVLASDTAYTYTVIALPIGKTSGSDKGVGKSNVKVTTGTIPAKGSKADKPDDVALEIDLTAKSITVTVTAPTTGSAIPNFYDVSVTKTPGTGSLTAKLKADTLTWTFFADENATYGDASTVYDWLNTPVGTYTATVFGYISPGTSSDDYFIASDNFVKTNEIKALYTNASLVVTPTVGYVTTSIAGSAVNKKVEKIYVFITPTITGSQKGVTYAIERAIVDEADKPGIFTPVTLNTRGTADGNGNYPYTPVQGNLVDIFGNFNSTTAYYDLINLPDNKVTYKYRLKATQDTTTIYITGNNITIDPKALSLAAIKQIQVGPRTSSGTNTTYQITPSTNYRGLLQNGDKLVLYWFIGNASDSYITGPYEAEKNVTFTKTELDPTEGAIQSRTLTVPANSGLQYLFVQAYLEYANGDKKSLDSGYWDTTGGYSTGIPNNGQYHVRLDY
jgi:hypothetical protein